MAFPFYDAVKALKPDNLIAQVWTGTAQSTVNHQGIRKSRTFENAYLECSSSLKDPRDLESLFRVNSLDVCSYALRLLRATRRALAPNGRSSKAPPTIVEGSGTRANVKCGSVVSLPYWTETFEMSLKPP